MIETFSFFDWKMNGSVIVGEGRGVCFPRPIPKIDIGVQLLLIIR